MMTLSAQRSVVLVMAAIGFCAPSAVGSSPAPVLTPNLVRQIDHVLISSNKAKELFSLLSETFEFPIAWPMSNYGSFASGGVAVGNVNLEVVRSADSLTGAGARLVGFALEPAPLRASLLELDVRRIPHGAPAPFRSKRLIGSSTTLWTTVALPSVSSDAVNVFFCEYGHDVPARRDRLHEQLRSREGGPLSVQSVEEIVCGTVDLKQTEEHWQRLLNPLQPSSPGMWQLGAGPAIHVVQADQDEIQQLIITVKSLEQARRFLRKRNLLGTDRPAAVTIASSLLQGLSITLVEGRSEGP